MITKVHGIACLCVLTVAIFLSTCGKEKPVKEVLVIPPNALFIINSKPVPAAYKMDTTQQWVILDSSAALKALLYMVEENYKQTVNQLPRK